MTLVDKMKAFKNKCYSVPDEEQAHPASNEGTGNQVESDQCSDANIDNYVSILIVMSFILSGVVFFFLIFAILSNFLDINTAVDYDDTME